MNLKKHTTSLEISLALRDAGYPQGVSIFYWVDDGEGELHDWTVVKEGWTQMKKIDAPLASELMEKIDSNFNEWSMGYNDSGCYWKFCFGGRGAGSMIEECGRTFSVLDLGGEDEYEDTPTNALAKLWLHLKKEGLLK